MCMCMYKWHVHTASPCSQGRVRDQAGDLSDSEIAIEEMNDPHLSKWPSDTLNPVRPQAGRQDRWCSCVVSCAHKLSVAMHCGRTRIVSLRLRTHLLVHDGRRIVGTASILRPCYDVDGAPAGAHDAIQSVSKSDGVLVVNVRAATMEACLCERLKHNEMSPGRERKP